MEMNMRRQSDVILKTQIKEHHVETNQWQYFRKTPESHPGASSCLMDYEGNVYLVQVPLTLT
jgi:hypothetical protein